MPVRALHLRFADSSDVLIRGSAFRALCVLVFDLVQATLVEGVLAEEMDGGQVQRPTASGASAGLEHGGFGAQVCDFLSLGLGFGAVTLDQTAVLRVRR